MVLILFISPAEKACADRSGDSSPSHSARNNTACIGKGQAGVDQHICGIYLHGLFGGTIPYSTYEAGYRKNLEKLVNNRESGKHCLIAAPVSPIISSKKSSAPGNHEWNGISYKQMLSMAEKACGDATFNPQGGMTLFGFSNGANWLQHAIVDERNCSSINKLFAKIVIIGPDHPGPTEACKKAGLVAQYRQHHVIGTEDLAANVFIDGNQFAGDTSRQNRTE